jgi:hypothetical protein
MESLHEIIKKDIHNADEKQTTVIYMIKDI